MNSYHDKTNQEFCNSDGMNIHENCGKGCPGDRCCCAPPCFPCQKQCQGGSATQGDLAEIMGDLTQSQGDQGENQGDLAEIQGDLTQSQGDQGENQGDLAEIQGDQTQTQGDQTESLGDLTQSQGSQTQGNQNQGDQCQTMTGHEGQIQGDQFLLNTPNISAPVTVSGLNLNLTVKCGENSPENTCENCNDSIAGFLRLLKFLASIDPAPADVTFYGCCGQERSLEGTLTGVVENCLAILSPSGGENPILVSLDAVEMVSVSIAGTEPDLFSRLLAHLRSPGCPTDLCHFEHSCYCGNSCYCGDSCHCGDPCRSRCLETLTSLLQSDPDTGLPGLFNTSCSQAEGYLYKVCHGIAYVVDDLENPSQITAIPVCRIKCWQTQKGA